MSALSSVCFIGGAPHSGSTLLGMILGSHTQVVYGGELRKSQFLGDETKPLKKRVCKLCGLECPVWKGLVPPFVPDVYDVLAERTGASVVVDSSKGTAWQRSHLTPLAARGVRARLVVLERDGRAVLASRLRKDPSQDPRAVIVDWLAQIERTDALADELSGSVMRVRYEELATAPEAETHAVTDFLDLDFEPAMLRFWEAPQHPLGGNDGTQSFAAREAARRAPGTAAHAVLDLAADKAAYYTAHPAAIVLDLRWQRELSPETRALFDELAGPVNARFEWPPREGSARP